MREKGFTLIEVLIAVTISGIILGSVGSFIYQGIRTWENTERGTSRNQNLRVLQNRLKSDLDNLFKSDIFEANLFKSDYEGINWLVLDDNGLKKVSYIFDVRNNEFVRRTVELDFRGREIEGTESELSFFTDIQIDRIDYEFFNSEYDYWQTNWDFPDNNDFLPLAVKINFLSDELIDSEIMVEVHRQKEY